jgi:hypothetical protein
MPVAASISLVRNSFNHSAEMAIFRKLIKAALRKTQGMRLAPTR